MKIVIDSREQAPFAFEHKKYAGTKIEAGALDTGDYSLAGLTDRVAVEREALPRLTSAILAAVGRGELEPGQAAALASLVATHGKILELAELEKRISALEGKDERTDETG